jgi:hypothetical protein
VPGRKRGAYKLGVQFPPKRAAAFFTPLDRIDAIEESALLRVGQVRAAARGNEFHFNAPAPDHLLVCERVEYPGGMLRIAPL